MTDTSFEARLARLGAKEEQVQHAAAPVRPKARSRAEKLTIALDHLARGGITGGRAYTPLFQALARSGIICKPLHYGSWMGLFLIFMTIMGLIAALVLFAAAGTDRAPRLVRTAIDLGPVVYLSGAAIMSVLFAAVHKIQAYQLGLPRWRDI